SPHPPEEFNSKNSDTTIESFSSSPIPIEDSDSLMEEIDLSFTPDDPMLPVIEEDDYDSEGDILILEELLSNSNTGTLNIKMLGDVSDQKVSIPNPTITRILNQEKSPDLFSHLGFEAFQASAECPMIINGKNIHVLDVPLSIFTPLIN
nr:hypothetical protein [Tanacetum cinerariifolium]GFA63048.1 hypothetical protein [Tanacetum cinerariifolium]